MTVNSDGLEPGQPVDFETIQRTERKRVKQPTESKPAPKRSTRARKTEE